MESGTTSEDVLNVLNHRNRDRLADELRAAPQAWSRKGNNSNNAAVLVPLFTSECGPSILFTLRSNQMSRHRNQVRSVLQINTQSCVRWSAKQVDSHSRGLAERLQLIYILHHSPFYVLVLSRKKKIGLRKRWPSTLFSPAKSDPLPQTVLAMHTVSSSSKQFYSE